MPYTGVNDNLARLIRVQEQVTQHPTDMPISTAAPFSEILSLSSGELPDVIDIVLWGFENPDAWLTADEVRVMIAYLSARTDARSPHVQEAIANCNDYLRQGFGLHGPDNLQTR
ncbi:protein of unknown function [Paraburkholderia kururiensis]|uniref:hypothetical protein n=1 Tax=Paraburkholderia kururiensis TaxID=984307 RepID=UPI0039A5845D